MKNREVHETGFTVFEALVALAILSLVAASVLSILSLSRRLEDRSQAKLMDTIQAQALLERLGLDLALEPGTHSGTLEDGRVWMIAVSAFSDQYTLGLPQGQTLYDVRVRVARSNASDEAAELRSIRRGPS